MRAQATAHLLHYRRLDVALPAFDLHCHACAHHIAHHERAAHVDPAIADCRLTAWRYACLASRTRGDKFAVGRGLGVRVADSGKYAARIKCTISEELFQTTGP